MTAVLRRPDVTTRAAHAAARPARRTRWPALALLAICLVQVGLAVRPGRTATPFEDEGLYVYMGHRMIDHLLHGAVLTEYPGAYFSGAPGFYPVLAALGDSVGGLAGARAVSLAFALGATVAVYGLGRQLHGTVAGLLGATTFVLCGSVIFQSDFATFDSTTLFLVAAASWLTVYSVRHDRYLWAPAVAVLLVAAFYAKYAGVVYAPVVAALAVAAAEPGDRLVVARRTAIMLGSGLALGYFLFALWGRSLGPGIAVTTTSRNVLNPASTGSLVVQVVTWVGPWLLLAIGGALLRGRSWPVSVVLLGGSVIGPLGQIRLGESTSLAKHVAFGMIFAAPLAGLLLARLLRRSRRVGPPVVLAVLIGLAASGVHYSGEFLTGWVSDAALVGPLTQLVEAAPGKPILGEQPAPERYALAAVTTPQQWEDTYSLSYGGETGQAAYRRAIDETSFGVIFLAKQPYAANADGSATAGGAFAYQYLASGTTPYQLVGTVDRVLHDQVVGQWYLYSPKSVPVPTS